MHGSTCGCDKTALGSTSATVCYSFVTFCFTIIWIFLLTSIQVCFLCTWLPIWGTSKTIPSHKGIASAPSNPIFNLFNVKPADNTFYCKSIYLNCIMLKLGTACALVEHYKTLKYHKSNLSQLIKVFFRNRSPSLIPGSPYYDVCMKTCMML